MTKQEGNRISVNPNKHQCKPEQEGVGKSKQAMQVLAVPVLSHWQYLDSSLNLPTLQENQRQPLSLAISTNTNPKAHLSLTFHSIFERGKKLAKDVR